MYSDSDLLHCLTLCIKKLVLLSEEERVRFIVNIRVDEKGKILLGNTSSKNDAFLNKICEGNVHKC